LYDHVPVNSYIFTVCRNFRPDSYTCMVSLKESEAYFTHFASWNVSEKAFLIRHYEKEVQPDSCICRADHLEVKRHLSDYTYIPKWKRTKATDKIGVRHCIYPDCEVTSLQQKLITPSFQPTYQLKASLKVTFYS